MISDKISEKAPLIYYSYRQIILSDNTHREINAANKITIRKHSDYTKNGIEFLIYNCALNATPELCDGIRQTHIVRDDDRIDFEGKGYSGNGVPLNNRYGCCFYQDGKTEIIIARKDKEYFYKYFNCFRDEHIELFIIDSEHLEEFFRSTYQLLKEMPYNPYNTWNLIRMCSLNYYRKKWDWHKPPFPYIFQKEWDQIDNVIDDKIKIALLKEFEHDLDSQFHEAFQYFKDGNHSLFKQEMDNMILMQGVYNLVYSTLL